MCATRLGDSIETERLRLRRPRGDDAWRIADLANDFDIARMVTSLPHPYAVADAEAFVSRCGDGWDQQPVFCIEHRQFGPIGVISFSRGEALLSELGYWFGRTFWGRGLATEATAAALAWARDVWGRRGVLSGHFADNPASARVLLKSGFLYTGEVSRRRCMARGEWVDSRMMVWLA